MPVSVAVTAKWRAPSISRNLSGTILFRKSSNASSVIIWWLDQIPACASECPTGASLFGPVKDLLIEAERRQNMITGKYYEFPVSEISSTKKQVHKAKKYLPKIYGKNDGGGTQVLMLAGVPFDKLGLPMLPDRSYTAIAENIQHTIYKGMILPIVAFGGLIYLVKRTDKNKKE